MTRRSEYDIVHIEENRYEESLMQGYLESARVFMALCDETRLKVLDLLRSGEMCASLLLEQVNVAQSTLSHHMWILVQSGIVNARKAGKWTYYSICENGRQQAIDMLTQVTATARLDGDGITCL